MIVSTEAVVATERQVTVETTATVVPEIMVATRKTLHTGMHFYTIAISSRDLEADNTSPVSIS